MTIRCVQCLTELEEERLGYETPKGEVLCGPCYFALWGPSGMASRRALSEHARPRSRRPARGRPIWMPGPTGELAPKHRAPRRWWRR